MVIASATDYPAQIDLDHLTIYLQDHHAGSVVGSELAKRAASNNEDGPFGGPLAKLAEQIQADRESLELLMAEIGVQRDVLKQSGGWLAEKFGRLKLNGSLTSYSPLSRLIEIEGLYVGVTGKLALWQNLERALGAEAITAADLPELIVRAEAQLDELAELRREAAAKALGSQSEA